MTHFKNFAWYGSFVALAAVLAVTLLVTGPAKVAHATPVTAVAPTAPIHAAGLTETWTVGYTASAVTGITTGAVTFPAGFVVPQGTIAGATATGAGAACTTVVATGAAQVVSFTMTSCAQAVAATNNFTIPGVKNPTATGATANFNVVTSVDADGATATAVIWGATVTRSPASIPADGASNSLISITPSHVTTNTGGGLVTITTTNGKFLTVPAPAIGGLFATALTVSADGLTASGAVDAATAVTAATVTLQAPTTAGSATISVRTTPAGGGAAILMAQGSVTFATAAADPGSVASGTISPTTVTIGSSSTQVLTVTWLDANGNVPMPGESVSASTTSGTLTTGTNGLTCTGTTQVCTGTVGGGGIQTVTLNGAGVAGTGTVTFTRGSVSAARNFTLAGAVSTVAIKFQSNNTSAGAFVDSATPAAAATGTTFRAAIDLRDAAGNRVVGQNATLTFSPASCATSDGIGDANVTATLDARRGIDPALAAGKTCTVTATANLKTASATFTVGSALATSSVVTVTAPDIATVTTGSITVEVKGSTGIPVADNTAVTLVVTAGAQVDSTVETKNGVATFTYVSPGTAQTVNATAVVGSVNASASFSVGAAVTPPPASGDGTFASPPSFGTGAIGSAVFNGGTVAQLAAAVTAAGSTSVWTQDANGTWRAYVVGAAAFVNAGFNTAFASGFAGATAVFVVK